MILNIETSTNVCSAAVTEGSEVLWAKRSDNGNHAHDLSLFIEELLGEVRALGKRLDAVGLSAGPGSYTGLRIGTATAKGLCYGLQIPLIAVETTEVLCVSLKHAGRELHDEVLCPMIDARRMEVYTALYDSEERRLTDVVAKVIDSGSFLEVLKERKVVFFGNGAEKCKSVIDHDNAVFLDGIVPLAEAMGVLAKEKFEKKEFVDLAYFAPFYLKEFQATVSHKAQDVLGI